MADLSRIPPTPTTVSVPLKASDRTNSCPEIDRCQLEVVHNDHPDLLTVEDGAGKNRKLVAVGMFQKGRGCDMSVRVGLVESGGPLAFGARRLATTTVVVEQINTASGQLLSRTSTSGTEAVGWDVPLGTTTKTESVPDMFTTTITTTTVTVFDEYWEVKLRGCMPPVSRLLNSPPDHMFSTRHVLGGATVAINRWPTADGNWLVQVDRRGPEGVASLRQQYLKNTGQSLWISASLDATLPVVYIVESRSTGDAVTAKMEIFAYNRYANEWQQTADINIPGEDDIVSASFYHVDRNGEAAGPFGYSAHTENTASGSMTCGDAAAFPPYGLVGDGQQIATNVCDTVFGGKFSPQGSWRPGEQWRLGMTIFNGELQPVWQVFAGGNSFISYDIETEWEFASTGEGGRRHSTNWEKHTAGYMALKIAGEDYGIEYFAGGHETFAAVHSGYLDTYGPTETTYDWTWTTDVTDYDYFAGSQQSQVTAGGWVMRTKQGSDRYHNSRHLSGQTIGGDLNAFYGGCWDFSALAYDEQNYTVTDEYTQKQVLHPIAIFNIDDIGHTFMAHDQESGTLYAGALITGDNGTAWRVWKDDDEITAQLGACLAAAGFGYDSFLGIYWRA